jgi:hypothetical protein
MLVLTVLGYKNHSLESKSSYKIYLGYELELELKIFGTFETKCSNLKNWSNLIKFIKNTKKNRR